MTLLANLMPRLLEDVDPEHIEIEKLKNLFYVLNERERAILIMRNPCLTGRQNTGYNLEQVQQEFFKRFGARITREQVRQVENKAMSKLRNEAKRLKLY